MSNKPLVPEGFLFDVSVSDLRSPQVLERIARRLIGKTFREIRSQGFNPDGIDRAYNNAAYKGGLGTLVEEYVFGYRANSDSRPDFVEANVELKTTCFDVKRNGDLSAGERLVLSMIPYDSEASVDRPGAVRQIRYGLYGQQGAVDPVGLSHAGRARPEG